MSRTLIIFGLVLVAAGLLWPLLGKLGLGRLPGDIAIERPTYSFYFPLDDIDPTQLGDQHHSVADQSLAAGARFIHANWW